MERKNYLFVLCIGLLIANCATSCSSTNIGNPPLDNRNSKDVLMGTITNTLLGNTDQQTIEKNKNYLKKTKIITLTQNHIQIVIPN